MSRKDFLKIPTKMCNTEWKWQVSIRGSKFLEEHGSTPSSKTLSFNENSWFQSKILWIPQILFYACKPWYPWPTPYLYPLLKILTIFSWLTLLLATGFAFCILLCILAATFTSAATGCVLLKKVFLKLLQNFTGKQLCWSLFLIKLQAFSPAILLKRDSNVQLFFCEICKISKNTNFKEDIRMDASVGFFYYLFSA